MGRFIIRRLIWTVFIVLLVSVLTFLIFFVLPSGDPALRFAGKQPTAELIAQARANLGLDKSLPEQYWLFLKHLVTGDEYGWPGLGYSFHTRDAVLPELINRARVTGSIIIGGAALWMLIGVPVGVISALKRRTIWDRGLMGVCLFFVSAPVFWLALLSLLIFWKKLHWLPGTGYVAFAESPGQWFAHLILPWCVLALLYAAIYARIVRANMIDVVSEDYIRTAYAKGLSPRRVVMHHELKPALAPVVALFATDLGALVGGTIVTETVFNMQGLGNWLLIAANNNDLPVTMAVTIVVAAAVSLLTLVADVLLAAIDPRVRLQ
ncbi:MAG: ABC transporter permease [Thermoleophilia bacterium]|nr:ABC transporter permease [Thermoleophilia bacterium]